MKIKSDHYTELAKGIIHDMDMDDLMNYGIDRMVKYFESLDDELFIVEWENHYNEKFPNK